jgi:serine/threonine-protein kinase
VAYGNISPASMILGADGSLRLLDPPVGESKSDARSDLYAVGAALFEVVTGKPPGPDVQLDPQLPAALKEIIRMSIAADPAGRFQSAAAFRNAVESVRSSLPAGAPTVSRAAPQAPQAAPPQVIRAKSHRGLYMLAGAVLAIAILVAAATQVPRWYRARAGEKAPEAAQPVTAPAAQAPEQPAAVPPAAEVAPAPAAQPPAAPAPARAARPPKIPAQPLAAAQPQAPPPAKAPEPAAAAPPPHPQADAGNAEALAKAREQLVMMAARANAAMKTMDNMERAQARSGFGMRNDMKVTRNLMESFLDQAEAALHANDAVTAQRNLDKAETQLDKLETWLGVK